MRIAFVLLLSFFAFSSQAKCPSGLYSNEGDEPFYKVSPSYLENVSLIFCGYSGKDHRDYISTGEYDIFLINSDTGSTRNKGPLLSFGAVKETLIYKSMESISIKDVWGGLTYTFDPKTLDFKKVYSYTPGELSEERFRELEAKILAGETDYTWPWDILDAVILGYSGADKLFHKLPEYFKYSAAGSEELQKAKLVYVLYKKANGI